MGNRTIVIDSTTEQTIRSLYEVNLSHNDIQFLADWFMMMGIGFTRHALQTNPQMTIGDLMHLTFNKHDS